MRSIICIVFALAVTFSAALPVCSATLVGQWTFDDFGGSDPLENKVASVNWNRMELSGAGATVVDGMLKLPRYQYIQSGSTAWGQSSARAGLETDFGGLGYFKSQTHVVWVYWPGFDTSIYSRITCVDKRNYADSCRANFCSVWSSPTNGWGTRVGYEYLENGQLSYGEANGFLGSTEAPPTDQLIKLAYVLKQSGDGYVATMYWDIGSGLEQVGEQTSYTDTQINPFGQYDSTCLFDPTGGKRYDYFSLMGFSWTTPESPGDIYFEEARLYSGALDSSAIAALTPSSRPGTDRVVGWWTFDYSGCSGPMYNKVPGVDWDTLTLSESGATVRDGVLHLSAYRDDTTWKVGNASTILRSARSPYSEKTFVTWLSLDNVSDPNNVASILRLDGDSKYDSLNWNGQFYPEISNGLPVSSYPFASNPMSIPRGQMVKLAAVYENDADSEFTVTYYLDKLDGSGLQQYGSPMRFADTYLNSYGYADTDQLTFVHDVEGLIGRTFGVSIDEARLYEVALTQDEIAGLTAVHRPVPVDAHLVGEWTFDDRGGSGGRFDKSPDSLWYPLALSWKGASVSDGKLSLESYGSGMGSASAMMLENRPAYRSKSIVAWLSLDGTIAPNSNVDLIKLYKSSTGNLPGDRICWENDQFIVKIRNSSGYESIGRPYSSNPPTIPADTQVKVAAVWDECQGSTMSVTLYLDKLDGSGLQQYGSTMDFGSSYCNVYGDIANDTIALIPSATNVDSEFCVTFEEVRLYDTMLDSVDIAKMVARQPSEFLSRDGASLDLNGRPYRAIGFNAPDLFSSYVPLVFDCGLWSSPTAQRQHILTAISDAGAHRIPFLRFWATGFYPRDMKLYFHDPDAYWQYFDEVVELCRQNGIRLVPSIYWNPVMWPAVFGETISSMVDPDSQSYRAMHDYARELALRYRDNPTVLMWEISNEMYLSADLDRSGEYFLSSWLCLPESPGMANHRLFYVLEDSMTTDILVQFYNDINTLLKTLDPNHLLESGDSQRRVTSESLRVNFPNKVWITDTLEQNLTNTRISQEMLDLYCYHHYVPYYGETCPGGLSATEYFRELVGFANDNGMPVYIGEVGQNSPTIDRDPTGYYLIAEIDTFESEGVDLMSLWTWYYKPQYPYNYYTGTSSPAVIDRVARFNQKYAQYAVATTNRAVYDLVTAVASANYDWVLWGKVTVLNSDQFTIDDGSGAPVNVIYSGHGLMNDEYVTVRGRLDLSSSPATLNADALNMVGP